VLVATSLLALWLGIYPAALIHIIPSVVH
jgi:hypothetical protein